MQVSEGQQIIYNVLPDMTTICGIWNFNFVKNKKGVHDKVHDTTYSIE